MCRCVFWCDVWFSVISCRVVWISGVFSFSTFLLHFWFAELYSDFAVSISWTCSSVIGLTSCLPIFCCASRICRSPVLIGRFPGSVAISDLRSCFLVLLSQWFLFRVRVFSLLTCFALLGQHPFGLRVQNGTATDSFLWACLQTYGRILFTQRKKTTTKNFLFFFFLKKPRCHELWTIFNRVTRSWPENLSESPVSVGLFTSGSVDSQSDYDVQDFEACGQKRVRYIWPLA